MVSISLYFIFSAPLPAGEFYIGSHFINVYHMAYEVKSPDNLPFQFQSSQKIPGIGQFYNDNSGYDFYLNYKQAVMENLRLILKLGYEYHAAGSSIEDIEYFFGSSLEIKSFNLLAGGGRYLNPQHKKVFVYLLFGPVLNRYSGITNLENSKLIFDYEDSYTFKFGLGIDVTVLPGKFYANLEALFDAGNIKRGYANYYLNNEWAAKLKPVGTQKINDDKIIIKAGISYCLFGGADNE